MRVGTWMAAGAIALSVGGCGGAIRHTAYPAGEESLFLDTGRPNALWTLPVFDQTIVPRSRPARFPYDLNGSGIQEFREQLEQWYDVRIVRVGTEEDVYRALDTTPDIALWIASGHGDGYSIQLGRGSTYLRNDQRFLDVTDTELAQHTKNLTTDAVVLADTCFGGYGRLSEWNIANALAQYTQRPVYSSDTVLQWQRMRVTSWYPFAMHAEGLRVTPERNFETRDATYLAQP